MHFTGLFHNFVIYLVPKRQNPSQHKIVGGVPCRSVHSATTIVVVVVWCMCVRYFSKPVGAQITRRAPCWPRDFFFSAIIVCYNNNMLHAVYYYRGVFTRHQALHYCSRTRATIVEHMIMLLCNFVVAVHWWILQSGAVVRSVTSLTSTWPARWWNWAMAAQIPRCWLFGWLRHFIFYSLSCFQAYNG